MSEIILTGKKIQFTDDNSNKTGLNFGDNAFYASALVEVDGSVLIKGNDIGASSSFSGATDLGDLSKDNISLIGSVSENTLTIQADPSAVSLNLVLPSSLGTPGQFLRNNGSGTLSFGELVTGYGRDHSWNFGTTKQLWSSAYGDPFAVTPNLSPVTPFYRSTNAHSSRQIAFASNDFLKELRLIPPIFNTHMSNVLSWDQGASYENWDFRATFRVMGDQTQQSTNSNVAGQFFFFGNDTIQDVVATTPPTGGRLSDSTGLAVAFNINATSSSLNNIQVFENGQNTKTLANQIILQQGPYYMFRIQKRGNILRIERSGISINTDVWGPMMLVHEHTLSSNTVLTGTRWGLVSNYAAGFTYFYGGCSYIECRVLEE